MRQTGKSLLDSVMTVAVLAAATLVIWGQLNPAGPSPPPPPEPRVQDVAERIDASAITKRRGTGRIALVEFADYECPYCARHTRDVSPAIKREFIDAGLVQHVFMNFPLESIHPTAFRASEAAECAALQGRFWEMHDRLFDATVRRDDGDIFEHARALALDEERFVSCLSGETSAIVLTDLAEGRRLDVRVTPTFFIGMVGDDALIQLTRRIDGALPFGVFREELDVALGRSQPSGRWWPF